MTTLATVLFCKIMKLLLWLALAQSVEIEPMGELAPTYGADYVGSKRCGECHQDLFEQQKSHHMARTARAARASDPLFSRPGEPDQAIPRSEEVAAILGSGIHGATPIRAAPGRTIREHLMSYSASLGAWFRTPGTEDIDDPLGSLKTVEGSRECLGCHATTIAWRDDRLDAFASELGVQCERCHGPGSAHIEAVVDGPPGASRIFNPSVLSRDAQVRFCAQCHRQPIDFEPLEVLGRVKPLARHAGAGLMMSACFRSSPRSRTLTCTDCHSPHRNVAPADHVKYRETCLRCHADPSAAHEYERVTPASDCVACHMRKESEGFYGLTFTDHWVRIPGTPPPLGSPREREELSYLELLYRNEWEADGIGEERRSRLALGLAEVIYGLERREDAFRWIRESLSHAPKTKHRLKAAAMFREGGDLDQAEVILRDAIRLDPDLLRAHFDLGEIAADRGEHERALSHYLRALAIRPDFVEAHVALGDSLRQLNRLTEALEHFGEADRLEPGNARALNGMAWVLATHPDPAARDPRHAVKLADQAAAATNYENPVVLDTLGAAYAASGDLETARNAVVRAIAIAETAGDDLLIAQLREHLTLYESGTVFVSPPPR
jgi:tetratricopeptide (TPR) repeat protein